MNQTAVSSGNDLRFGFGANWSRFLSVLNEHRISKAEQSLKDLLAVEDLKDKTFLDVGCGSGLFSLAARRLGAQVHSFDFDPESIGCAQELKRRYFPHDQDWVIARGSALDNDYLQSLGCFDVVYSWGVLHHTGAMWQAMDNVQRLVRSGGKLAIAIYNDQGWTSTYWGVVKRAYNQHPMLRIGLIAVHMPYLFGLRWIVRALTRSLSLDRGMSLWYDMIDWLGGHPFEVAKPEEVHGFYQKRGFALINLKTCGGRHGCNELEPISKSLGHHSDRYQSYDDQECDAQIPSKSEECLPFNLRMPTAVERVFIQSRF